MKIASRTLSAILSVIAMVSSLAAQVGAGRGTGGSMTVTGGWTGTLDCLQCTVHLSPSGTWVEFGAEPVVRVASDKASVFLDGDVLIAVDDMLITTPAGARRTANLGGVASRFTVRRNGREVVLVIPRHFQWKYDTTGTGKSGDGAYRGSFEPIRPPLPTAGGSSVIGMQIGSFGFNDLPAYTYARPDPMSAFGTTSKPLASTEDSTARLNTADMSLNTTRGWLGIALDCLRCTADRVDLSSHIPPVHFTTPPRVVAVEPGAAAAAGFRVGDVIRTIDGKQMASPGGAARFSNMQGGERVVFGVERGKQLITLTLVVPKPY